MKFIVSILVILLGLLSAAAPAFQLRAGEKRTSHWVMLAGGSLFALSGVGKLVLPFLALPLAVIGALLTCGAAVSNGLQNGQVHLSHHMIRAAAFLVLTVGLALC